MNRNRGGFGVDARDITRFYRDYVPQYYRNNMNVILGIITGILARAPGHAEFIILCLIFFAVCLILLINNNALRVILSILSLILVTICILCHIGTSTGFFIAIPGPPGPPGPPGAPGPLGRPGETGTFRVRMVIGPFVHIFPYNPNGTPATITIVPNDNSSTSKVTMYWVPTFSGSVIGVSGHYNVALENYCGRVDVVIGNGVYQQQKVCEGENKITQDWIHTVPILSCTFEAGEPIYITQSYSHWEKSNLNTIWLYVEEHTAR